MKKSMKAKREKQSGSESFNPEPTRKHQSQRPKKAVRQDEIYPCAAFKPQKHHTVCFKREQKTQMLVQPNLMIPPQEPPFSDEATLLY
ncbi:hypothetical protein QN277_027824 [Acacia crassicarpa]|uniref:Uncharacterized protein n=1 Tax=Acacia crassicarpa TaxID=499986 RepID=A0AAE1J1U1_9FABA|nr:hypothetical protein QN277_027824 [Acacia crassicarpa]